MNRQLACTAAPAASPLLAHEGEGDGAAGRQGGLVGAGFHELATQLCAGRLHSAPLRR